MRSRVGRVDNPDSDFCLVTQLRRHFLENYSGEPSDFVFTRDERDARYLTRTAFTEGLRLRLVNGGRHLGLDIDPRAWSGISFRKGSLQTAADNGTL